MDVTMIRKRLTLSQDECARLLGISQSLLSHWERGTRVPDRYQVEQLELLSSASVAPHSDLAPILRTLKAGRPALACALLLGLGRSMSKEQDQA